MNGGQIPLPPAQQPPSQPPVQQPPQPGSPQPPVQAVMYSASGGAGMNEMDLLDEVKAFFRRVFASDFRTEQATRIERSRLARRGVVDPLAQNFVAWRSSILYVSAVCLLFYGIWNLATFTMTETEVRENVANKVEAALKSQFPNANEAQIKHAVDQQVDSTIRMFGSGNLGVVDNFKIISLISVLIGAAGVIASAVIWPMAKASRIMALVSWLIMFVTPLILSMFPVIGMMDMGHLKEQEAEELKKLLGFVFAVEMLSMTGPRVLALLPGVTRASLTLKTFLPESPTPGWAAAAVSPLWGLFLFVIIGTVNQLQGSYKLLIGFLFLFLAAMIPLITARRLIKPCTLQETTMAVTWPRRIAAVFNIVGVILIVWSVFEFPDVHAGKVIAFLVGTLGNVFLMSVVASDIVLAMMRMSFKQEQEFLESEYCKDLDAKLSGIGRDLSRKGAAAPAGQPAPVVIPAQLLRTADVLHAIEVVPATLVGSPQQAAQQPAPPGQGPGQARK